MWGSPCTYTREMTTMAGTLTNATRLSFQLWRNRKMSVPTACTVVVVVFLFGVSEATCHRITGMLTEQTHKRSLPKFRRKKLTLRDTWSPTFVVSALLWGGVGALL